MSEFVENLDEVFASFGAVRARRMFGGYGIYHDDLMFALVADDELYLKVDDQSVETFAKHGLGPFVYEKNGKQTTMSYYLAPDELFEDHEVARTWAVLAYDAALRARKKKPGKR